MYWIVYQTTNKINGKLYIGVHKTENPNVFDGYIGNGIKVGRNLLNPKTVFQKALKKYGYTNFERKTLFIYDNPKEAYEKESSIVTLEFINRKDVYNTATGGCNPRTIRKKVYQYSLKGTFVKEWLGGQSEIIDELGVNYNELAWALFNQVDLRQSYWSFTEVTDFTKFRRRAEHYVYQFDLFGNLIDIHENLTVVAKKFNITRDSMKDHILRKSKYKGYYWTLDIDAIYHVIKINQLFNTKRKYVQMVDTEGIVLQEYASIKDAAKALGYKPKSISSLVSRHTLIDGKYYLQYLHDPLLHKKPVLQIDLTTGHVVKTWDSLTECRKHFPKCKEVLKGCRNMTKGYTFKFKTD